MNRRSLTRFAWLSIAAAILTIALKAAAYLLTGSVGLLSDALESFVNLVGALMALTMLIVAARPPDDDHAFGHDKAEYFSSILEGTLVLVAASAIGVAAVQRLLRPRPLEQIGLGLVISVVASLVNLGVGLVLLRAGKRHHSITLEANAHHLLTDVWTSAGVLVGVGAVALTGWQQLDPIVAFIVAGNIIATGVRLVRGSVSGLMDSALPIEDQQTLQRALARYADAGVQYHALRTHQAGARRFVSLHVLVPGGWTVQRGHRLLERIEADIRSALPHATVFTHLESLEDPASWDDVELDRSAAAPPETQPKAPRRMSRNFHAGIVEREREAVMGSEYEIVIVGASVAGASTAIALAPEGYRILLLDQAVFPREKPCGEGIMPQGVQILAELGLLQQILDHGGTKVRGMRYRNRQGLGAEADFPRAVSSISYGVVMRRYHLDNLLLQRAKSFPNVSVREGFRVTEVVEENGTVRGVVGHPVDSPTQREVFHAPLTIGADGRHSVFHAACGLRKIYLRRKRFGVTGHLTAVEGVSSYVEVLAHPDGEIYVAPCGQNVTLVALLLEERAMKFFKGDLTGRYRSSLGRVEGFRERIAKSELVPPVSVVGPLGFTIEPCYRPGLLLIGDSAGFLDPITGEGMTLALKSVKAAVPLIKEAFTRGSFGAELGRRYAENRLRLVEDVFRFTRLLLNLSRHKFIADRVIRRLSHDERLFKKLLGIVTGSHRYCDLSLAEKISLVTG